MMQFPRDQMLLGPLAAALLPWQLHTLTEHLRAVSGSHSLSTTPWMGKGVNIAADPPPGPGPGVQGLSPWAKLGNPTW